MIIAVQENCFIFTRLKKSVFTVRYKLILCSIYTVCYLPEFQLVIQTFDIKMYHHIILPYRTLRRGVGPMCTNMICNKG